ncbi:MAG: ABC transporter permease [Euryarchaeota archaeon]|jgi:ABC-2 type transport system permease protein|nr:ABC transporter permease [Euryarchaeota archaeon]MBT3971936.1 ABC transporter permease [Euryarchaeota archaeon]MBT4407426.1 ABC transporter permease [Euryarchaeota archaeon]MBT6645048.1 ABC transporter permease [Euryarchaeota archaeon]
MTSFDISRAYAIGARKFASLRRDKRMFGFIIIMPALQILLFGIAIGQSPSGLDVAIINNGTNEMSENFSSSMGSGDEINIHETYSTLNDAIMAVEDGELWGVIVIEDGPMDTIDIEMHLDNSNQQITNTIIINVRDAANAAFESQGISLSITRAEPIYGAQDPQFIDFLAPGIITMVCAMFSLILTSMAFVGERYDGTLDRVFAAGTKPSEVLVGHLIAFSTILVGQVFVVIFISRYGFNIMIEGSILLLFLLALLLGWAAMCFGLLVSSKAKSEFQAMQVNMPIIFPVLLLSGILWPTEALPEWIQPFSWAMPTTWTAEAFRSIMIRGWGLENEIIQGAFLFNGLFALIALILATRSLKTQE